MRIGVPKEIHAGERRVATVPEVAEKLAKLGFSIAVMACVYLGRRMSAGAPRSST